MKFHPSNLNAMNDFERPTVKFAGGGGSEGQHAMALENGLWTFYRTTREESICLKFAWIRTFHINYCFAIQTDPEPSLWTASRASCTRLCNFYPCFLDLNESGVRPEQGAATQTRSSSIELLSWLAVCTFLLSCFPTFRPSCLVIL